MRIIFLTIFPELIEEYFRHGVLGRAKNEGLLDIVTVDIRVFGKGRYRAVDDLPYGGGAGMVMACGPIVAALESLETAPEEVLYTSPAGVPFTQEIARELAQKKSIVILCGRYEGIDQRIVDHCVQRTFSLGDSVVSGGELPALMIADAVGRLLPGALGNAASLDEESFGGGLLEYPQYTRPPEFRGWQVPEVLTGGHHANIEQWRKRQRLEQTLKTRPELLSTGPLQRELFVALVHFPVLNREGQVAATSVTNLDVHDIARLAKSYGVKRYFLIVPSPQQRELVGQIGAHWVSGAGGVANPDRKQALELVQIAATLAEASAEIEHLTGHAPEWVGTSARADPSAVPWQNLRARLRTPGSPLLLLLGTGHGLAPEILEGCRWRLPPIGSPTAYNHLSVRSAAAITLDRLVGDLYPPPPR